MESPTANQPVLLRGDSGEFASRVEDVTDGFLTLARPFGLPLDTDLDEGRPFDVQWTSATGVYTLPVRVTERAIDGKIRIWHAVPIGPARMTNRRAHVRVPMVAPMTLEIGEESIEATLLDVSEAALRCQVADRLPPREDPTDRSVRVNFTVAGEDFALDGILYRSTPVARPAWELVITLPEDERTASSVRRAVFAEQIRARQLNR